MGTDKAVYGKEDVVRVKFTIKNSGQCFGAEVVQLYMSQPVCSVMRPVKELKGFEKVFLQSGETRTLEIPVKVADLAFYDEISKGWKVEPGDFVFHLGTSSGEMLQTVKIAVR